MKFFIPLIEDAKKAYEVYKSSIEYLKEKGESIALGYKIYSVILQIGGIEKDFIVGKADPISDDLIVMIFENNNDFIICTTSFDVNGSKFHKHSKENPYKIDYFNKMEYNYKDWWYALDNFNCHKVKHPLEHPKTVYKYYSNTKLNREAIINNYLFSSHPYHLNDPMDFSSMLWDFSGMTEGRYNGFFEFHDLPKEVSYSTDRNNNFNEIKTKFWEIHTDRSGIISLSKNELNTLMWAHYSSENGFCVEFNIDKLINEIVYYNKDIKNYVFMPVQYVENIDMIDFFAKEFPSPDIPLLYALNIKKADWKYEEEWRLVCYSESFGIPYSLVYPLQDNKGKTERKIYYGKDVVESIVLGQRFFNGKNIAEIKGENIYRIEDTDENPTNNKFINFIYENYNDKLFMCDNFDPRKSFKRSTIKVILEKLDENTFKIIKEKDRA